MNGKEIFNRLNQGTRARHAMFERARALNGDSSTSDSEEPQSRLLKFATSKKVLAGGAVFAAGGVALSGADLNKVLEAPPAVFRNIFDAGVAHADDYLPIDTPTPDTTSIPHITPTEPPTSSPTPRPTETATPPRPTETATQPATQTATETREPTPTGTPVPEEGQIKVVKFHDRDGDTQRDAGEEGKGKNYQHGKSY